MTAKRFTIDGYSDVNKIDDNQTEDFFIIANGLDTWKLCDLLNALHEENQQIKNSIQEAYENERTQIGKNVLKQLIEQIEE